MSILIPDMKMPKYGCKSCGFDIYGSCLIKANMDKSYEVTHSCPLIELPPHGDLIDRNHLEVVSYHNSEGMEDTFDNGVKWMLEYIDKLTPVIPAEEE